MPGWATFKLGRPRKELVFDGIVDGPARFQQRISAKEKRVRNSGGESFKRTFRKQMGDFSVLLSPPVSDSVKGQLESLRMVADEPLSFVFANDWPIHSDRQATTSLTTVKLKSSPFTRLGKAYKDAGGLDTDIIKITGVFTDYKVDGSQVSTNFFTGGSYAADSRVITLGNGSPGPTNTIVFVNWTYTGALINFLDFRPAHIAGNIDAGTAQWGFALQLEGV